MSDPRIDEATTLMNNFALRTGLTSSLPQRRYLWTDAFAICNYLGLARSTGEFTVGLAKIYRSLLPITELINRRSDITEQEL